MLIVIHPPECPPIVRSYDYRWLIIQALAQGVLSLV